MVAGGGSGHHPRQVSSRRRRRQGGTTQDSAHEVTESHPSGTCQDSWSTAGLVGKAGWAQRRGRLGTGTPGGRRGRGPSRMQGMVDTFSADAEQLIMLSRARPYPCLPLSWQGRAPSDQTKDETPKARLPERGLKTRAFGVVQGTGIHRLGDIRNFPRRCFSFPRHTA